MRSLAIGFILSLLGTLLLLTGSLSLFAGERSQTLLNIFLEGLYVTLLWTVLYAFGTVISLVGTGFLIGVSTMNAARAPQREGLSLTFGFMGSLGASLNR